MLNNIYKAAFKNSPAKNIFQTSSEKVENVVSPPQNPTVKNSLNSFGTLIFSINSKKPNPIIKLPIMLTLSVPKGKQAHIFEHARVVK